MRFDAPPATQVLKFHRIMKGGSAEDDAEAREAARRRAEALERRAAKKRAQVNHCRETLASAIVALDQVAEEQNRVAEALGLARVEGT